MTHTKACGVEAYDKHYGIGYQVGRGELSPYPRVNRLRKVYLDTEFYIDAQRALLVTEAYQKYENEPQVIKCARALENVLLNVKINIEDDELLVGQAGGPYKMATIFPEFSYKWIIDEMDNAPFDQREHDEYYMDEKTAQDLRSIAAFWDGKTVSEEIERNLSWEDKKGSNMGRGLYLLNLYHLGGVGHFCADYATLLAIGYNGILARVEEKLAQVDSSTEEGKKKHDFYTAQQIVLKASIAYVERYAVLADERAAVETNPVRRRELEQIAANCHQVAGGPARTTWEALQLWYIATEIILAESNGHSVSYGRMDQWLYPYYKADRERGVSKETIQKLLEVAYL